MGEDREVTPGLGRRRGQLLGLKAEEWGPSRAGMGQEGVLEGEGHIDFQ